MFSITDHILLNTSMTQSMNCDHVSSTHLLFRLKTRDRSLLHRKTGKSFVSCKSPYVRAPGRSHGRRSSESGPLTGTSRVTTYYTGHSFPPDRPLTCPSRYSQVPIRRGFPRCRRGTPGSVSRLS